MRKWGKYLSMILFLAVMMLPTAVFADVTEDEAAGKSAVTVIGEDTDRVGNGDENNTIGDAVDDNNAADDDESIGEDTQENNWNRVDLDGFTYWQYLDEETGTPFCAEFVLIGENIYCFDENGYLMTGLIEITDISEEIDGIYYAVEAVTEEDTPENSSLGAIIWDSWVLLEDEEQTKYWIRFDEDGRAVEPKDGWNKIDGTWYWLKKGVPATGWRKIYKKWYYFSAKEDGAMQTGWQTVYGKKYYLSKSQNDGAMKTGWQKIDGKWYYFGGANDGSMKTGWKKIGSKWYYLSNSLNDGAMKSGWQKIYGKWYYLGGANDGAMKYGWRTIGGKKYYLGGANDGAMKTGWKKLGGQWYYFGGANDGAMKTGWQKVGNYWYYMYSSGVMASSTWIGSYYVNSSGRWVEMDYVWPLPGYTYISSDYGYRTAPTAGASSNHQGIDIPAPGGTPIRAVADGTVTTATSNQWNGNYIEINHGNGLKTKYLHMSGFAVSEGTKVKAGQVIGYVGTTGVSTGNHLHLGFYENGNPVSPWNYVQRM